VTRDKAALAIEVAAVTARAEDERTQREAGLARLARLQKLYVCLHPTHSDMLALADEHAALLCLCLCLCLYLHVHVAGIVLSVLRVRGGCGRLEKKIDEELDAEEKAKDAANTIARLTVRPTPPRSCLSLA
jgi:hypothetical protein